jgi:hypothetical protein
MHDAISAADRRKGVIKVECLIFTVFQCCRAAGNERDESRALFLSILWPALRIFWSAIGLA